MNHPSPDGPSPRLPRGSPAPPGHLQWRWRGVTVVGLAASALVLGLLVRSPAALLFSLPLLLAVPATLLVSPQRNLLLRVSGETALATDQSLVDLRIQSVPPTPGLGIEMVVHVPPEMSLEGPRVRPLTLDARGGTRTALRLSSPHPVVTRLPIPLLRWRDPLSLGSFDLAAEGDPVPLEQYPPEVHRIARIPAHRTIAIPGDIVSSRKASQGEFSSVRAYEPGDARRQVNWWATARTGNLSSNEFLAEQSGELVVVLDVRPGPHQDRLVGIGRAATLGLLRALSRTKTRTGLTLFGEFPQCLPLGSGRRHLYQEEEMLRSVPVSAEGGLPQRLAVALRRHYPPNTLVLFVSPLTDEATQGIGYLLRRRGFPTLILSPSPLALERPLLDLGRTEDEFAWRLLRLRRRRDVAEAWQSAPVVEWEDFQTLAPLVGYLLRPMHRPMGRSA